MIMFQLYQSKILHTYGQFTVYKELLSSEHLVFLLHCSQLTVSDSCRCGFAVCPQMPILKRRWSILGPKGLSIQWRSLQSPPASFSMISLARRSPVKRLNPSQVRFAHPFTVLLYQPSYSERSRNNGTLLFIYHFYKRVCFFMKRKDPHLSERIILNHTWKICQVYTVFPQDRFGRRILGGYRVLTLAQTWQWVYWTMASTQSCEMKPSNIMRWDISEPVGSQKYWKPHTPHQKKKKILAAESYSRVQMDTM